MLELRNISFDVTEEQSDVEILRDINLTVPDKSFLAITGPNGGGKSTLARIIMGVIKPTSGSIIFDGEDITGLDITERARLGISYAFQTPVRFKGVTVLDLLRVAVRPETERLTAAQACQYLDEVGLDGKNYINREVNDSLSGGELKRIEIASVLARGTKLTVFDEPEAGIDLWSFQNLIKVFEKLQKDHNGSIIIISHQERILEIADEIVLLSDGVIVEQGPRDEILPAILDSDNVQGRLFE